MIDSILDKRKGDVVRVLSPPCVYVQVSGYLPFRPGDLHQNSLCRQGTARVVLVVDADATSAVGAATYEC